VENVKNHVVALLYAGMQDVLMCSCW